MSGIINRIKAFAAEENLSIRQIELSIGASNGLLSKKGDVSSAWVSKIIEAYPQIDPFWLLTGRLQKKIGNTPLSNSENQLDSMTFQALPHTLKPPNASKNASPTASPTLKTDQKTGIYALSEIEKQGENTSGYNLGVPQVVTVNERQEENIIYVPVKARAGYLNGYGDPVFIQQLPSYRLPGLSNGTYRMFETEGPSMAPNIISGDKVIGQWVGSLAEIRDNYVYIVVSRNDGVVVKRLLNRINQRGKIVLKSDTIHHRKEYPTYEIDPSDILELWFGRLKLSADFSEPSEVYHRLADLEGDMTEVKQILASLTGLIKE